MDIVELVTLFKDDVEVPDNYTDCCWYKDSGSIIVNEDDDVNELMQGDGDTYHFDVYGSPIEKDGILLYKLYNCCGEKFQAFFSLDKKVDADKYWEDYEEGEEDE